MPLVEPLLCPPLLGEVVHSPAPSGPGGFRPHHPSPGGGAGLRQAAAITLTVSQC